MTDKNPDPTHIRLAKRVAEQLNCSRSTAEQFIEGGFVSVDGRVEEAPGARVRPDQAVAVAPDASLLLSRYNFNGNYERDQANTPLAADSAGNSGLQPEKATAFELAFETQLPAGGVFSVGAFHRQIDRLIRRRIALETVPEAPLPAGRMASRVAAFRDATLRTGAAAAG